MWVIVAFFLGILVGLAFAEGALKMANKAMTTAQNHLSRAQFERKQINEQHDQWRFDLEKKVRAEFAKAIQEYEKDGEPSRPKSIS